MMGGTFALVITLLVLGPIWWQVAAAARGLSEGNGLRTFGRKLHVAILATLLAASFVAAVWLAGDMGLIPRSTADDRADIDPFS